MNTVLVEQKIAMNEPEVIPQTKGAQVPCNEDLPRNNTKIIDNGDCNQVESATSPQYVPVSPVVIA